MIRGRMDWEAKQRVVSGICRMKGCGEALDLTEAGLLSLCTEHLQVRLLELESRKKRQAELLAASRTLARKMGVCPRCHRKARKDRTLCALHAGLSKVSTDSFIARNKEKFKMQRRHYMEKYRAAKEAA